MNRTPFNPRHVRAGTYKGKIEKLRGQRALVRPGPLNLETQKPACVLAQFDDRAVSLGSAALGFGWHEFPVDAFELDLELADAD